MAETTNKRPASQYYWGEWLSDKALQSCSLTARGLWHEMNCHMHQGEPYGHLTLNGRAMSTQQLANLVRVSLDECTRLLCELELAGVFSRTKDRLKTIFSRRMVRDEARRSTQVVGGQKGAQYGALGAAFGARGGRPRRGVIEPPPRRDAIPPSSSSSSSATALKEEPAVPAARSSRKPPSHFPITADMRAWAVENTPAVDVGTETATFVDHTFATARKDWLGTWRNWMRREQKANDVRTGRRGTSQSTLDLAVDTMAGLTGRRHPPLRSMDHGDPRPAPPPDDIVDIVARAID